MEVLKEITVFIFMGNGNIGFLLLSYSCTKPYGVICQKVLNYLLNSNLTQPGVKEINMNKYNGSRR